LSNRFFNIDNRTINENSRPYIIAEIGHNHGGSVEKCKDLISLAKECNCDAVKLQKRDNKSLYTEALYNSPYENIHSFGRTYGEHREALEFNFNEYREIIRHADFLGIFIFATAFDIKSVDVLCYLNIKAIKIASGDIRNTPLISYAAKQRIPLIISTGGADYGDIADAVEYVERHHKNYALLHCVATYPNYPQELNLKVIEKLKIFNPGTIIGFSSHYDGVLAGICAFNHGAQIIEYHFTDSHVNKGSDHALSLQPQGMKKLTGHLKHAYMMRGGGFKERLDREDKALYKMEKSIYLKKAKPAGYKIKEEDLVFKSPGGGLPPARAQEVIGQTLGASLTVNTPLLWDYLIKP